MNTSLRMILVLGLISALAAGLLAGVNIWTAPIIEENTAIRLQQTLARVIDADEFIQQEGTEFRLWHAEKGGKLVGCVVRLTGQGYSSSGIEILVGLDTEATVKGVHIFSHSETPGLGDKILGKVFLGQFAGKGLEDPIASGADVDSITGSTSSAMAVIASVRRAVQFVGRYTGLIEDQVVDFADIPDGVYAGTGRGFGGDIDVEVTFSGGKLIEVKIISHKESVGYSDPAIERIPKAITDQQEIDVDIISGATATSEGIIAAVRDALAEFVGGGGEEPIDIPTLANGKYIGLADSFGGELRVEVIMSNGRIVNIIVVEHNDTKDYADPALPILIDRIVESQELDVDVVSGASRTSVGLMDAVKNALRSERVIEISELVDGVYAGEADSFGGKLHVQVTVVSGAITDIQIISHNDTTEIAAPAFNIMVDRIVSAQTIDVDVVTEATISSKGLKDAIAAALRNDPLLDVSKIPDGLYEGIGNGFMGDMLVRVSVSNGKITEIEVLEHSDTHDYAQDAFRLIDIIKEQQTIYVDVISGATYSSKGFLEALEAALRGASQ